MAAILYGVGFVMEPIFLCLSENSCYGYRPNDKSDIEGNRIFFAEYMVLSTATKNWKAIFHFYLDELDMTFWSARLFKKIER